MKTLRGILFLLSLTGLASGAVIGLCPAVGADTGCGILITVTAQSGGVATAFTVEAASDPVQPPYDAGAVVDPDDTLIGVLNNSGGELLSLTLSSPLAIFGFDGDGPCSSVPAPPTTGCNILESSGYGGPGVSFSGISGDFKSGTVNFDPAIADEESAWFALEEAPDATEITPGVPEPASSALFGVGLLGLAYLIRRRRAA